MNAAEIGASQLAAPNTNAGKADTKLADNFDTFLKLLTTQLQHQDPLDPMDATQFTQQLVQFSQVEQSIEANKNLEQLLALASTNSAADAVAYLGKIISAVGKTNMLSNGKAEYEYRLPEKAASTTIAISDGAGKLVYATKGNLDAGSHNFTWDGKDNQGKAMIDGPYTIAVSSLNSVGETIAVENYVSGVVTGIQNDENNVYLMLQDVAVPTTSVRNVSPPTTATAAAGV